MANIRIDRSGPDPFAMGRGYQTPSPGGEPPNWGQDYTTEILPPEPAVSRGIPQEEIVPQELDMAAAMNMQELIGQMVADAMPKEFVNLDRATARFRDYDVDLSPETVAKIEAALATEVENKLRQEMERVLRSVRDKGLSANPNAGLAHMREVQAPTPTVGPEEPKAEVLRVRKPQAATKSKNVRKVSRPKDDETSPGDAA